MKRMLHTSCYTIYNLEMNCFKHFCVFDFNVSNQNDAELNCLKKSEKSEINNWSYIANINEN